MLWNCYQIAVGAPPAWGIQPAEFWEMSHEEWWKLFDVRRTDRVPGTSLTESQLHDLYELLS